MPRMIEVSSNSALPSNTMQFAAKGALLVPPQEMIEILVYLATRNKVFGEQARMTLAGWDETSSREAAANPQTPKEVLQYLIDPQNLRPALLPLLVENPSISEHFLITLAASATREQVEVLLQSARVNNSGNVLSVLAANPYLKGMEAQTIKEKLAPLGSDAISLKIELSPQMPVADETEPADSPEEEVNEEAINAFLTEHAAEIAAEEQKPFKPIGGLHEEHVSDAEPVLVAVSGEPAAAPSNGHEEPAPVRRAPAKKWILSAEEQRGSALQKIAKLDVKGRIQLAMKGNKEERSLLIRDGTKIVAISVLESPKLTDGEVEKFASQKNVLEAVLRAIPMKRRFMKLYPVIRNLTFNPRTPIDVSLALIKNLLIQDLRNLSGNKEVSDTVRKLATKMFRQKLDVTKK